jgi:hypothetical protein
MPVAFFLVTEDGLTPEEGKISKLITEYRTSLGLPEIPLSPNLTVLGAPFYR